MFTYDKSISDTLHGIMLYLSMKLLSMLLFVWDTILPHSHGPYLTYNTGRAMQHTTA
jgi:hypothetical protein